MKNKKIILAGIAAFFLSGNIHAQSGIKPVSTYTFTGKPQYQIRTTRAGVFLGNINVELFPAIAPNHVKNFDSLVSKVFFDTTAFHRVIPGFVIQGGDPNSRHGPKSTWGNGDPSQPTVNAEFSAATHLRGTLAAARDANINSANSQFYICVAPQPGLDNNYTIYGHVISGMNICDTIVTEPRDVNDCPNLKIEMFVTYTGSNDTLATNPVLNTPLSGTQNIGPTKQLKWNKASDDIMYHLDVSTDSMFSTFLKSVNVGVNYNTIVGLQGSTTYYWRVKSTNGGNWSGYSPVWNFSTTMNASIHNLTFTENGYRLDQNIPNPSSGQTIIKYAVPGKGTIQIRLYDVSGNEIATILNEEKNKGEYQITLDMSKYATGTYFYTMQAGDMSDTRKIVLEK
jgi:peptidyl-prolyl cis-trans isomerase B (cyclophilin B)